VELVGRTQSQPADTPGRTLLNPEARKCTSPDRTVLILSPGGNETVLGGRQFFPDPALASPRYHGWLQLQRCFQVMRRPRPSRVGSDGAAPCGNSARGQNSGRSVRRAERISTFQGRVSLDRMQQDTRMGELCVRSS
jgi:hypothetical protein